MWPWPRSWLSFYAGGGTSPSARGVYSAVVRQRVPIPRHTQRLLVLLALGTRGTLRLDTLPHGMRLPVADDELGRDDAPAAWGREA